MTHQVFETASCNTLCPVGHLDMCRFLQDSHYLAGNLLTHPETKIPIMTKNSIVGISNHLINAKHISVWITAIGRATILKD